jgi:hypothetical protein
MNAHRIIGKDIPRADGRAKATGQAVYADDIKLPGMLYGKLLRSPLPHARILSIDTRRAAAMTGVHCVITGQDIPRVTYGNWRLFPAPRTNTPWPWTRCVLSVTRSPPWPPLTVKPPKRPWTKSWSSMKNSPVFSMWHLRWPRGRRPSTKGRPPTSASTARSPTGTSRPGLPHRTMCARTPLPSMR